MGAPDADAPNKALGRRAFIGRLSWVTSGVVIGSAAALETVSAAPDPSGPTGPSAGGAIPQIPATGSGSAAVAIAAAALVVGGAAALASRRPHDSSSADA
jgi:LPXTG-motif cell wall-anchored protein